MKPASAARMASYESPIHIERRFCRALPVAMHRALAFQQPVELRVDEVDVAIPVSFVGQVRAVEIYGQPFLEAEWSFGAA